MKETSSLPNPDKKTIEKYLALFEKDEKAKHLDKTISKVIRKFPKNDNLEDIIIKICIINKLYSTNIFSVYNLAKHISTLNFDEAILKTDYSIVNRIATGHGIKPFKKGGDEKKEYIFYSFATKYCSWHDQFNFPIFDSNIDLVLRKYNVENKYVSEGNFRNYENLVNTLKSFRNKHNLKNYSLKEIDKFLWYLGGEIKENMKNEKL